MTALDGRADVADRSVARQGPRLPSWLVRFVTVAGPLLVYTAVGLWMFRGNQTLGMEFDEVFRVNNLVAVQQPGAVPYSQAISSVEIFGVSVPLMYKAYISSAYLVSFLPLGLFPDPLVGIRTLYMLSLVLAASVAFLLFRSRAYWVAAGIPLLAMVSPLLYPEIVYGFVDVQYMIPLLVAAWFSRRYVRQERVRDVFGAVLFAGIALNISFYTAWLLAALGVAAVCFYWSTVWSVLRSARKLAAAVLALTLGCFNYVYYNLTAGFPSLRPLVNRFLFPEEYKANPIDFKKSDGVLADAAARLPLVWDLLGAAAWFVTGALALALVVTTLSFVQSVRTGRLRTDRLLYVPSLAMGVAFVAIIVSPNTTRRGHYGMLVGLLEAAAVAAVILALRMLPRARPALVRAIAVALFVVYFAFTAGVSRTSVDRKLESGGTGYFSAAIFDLYDFLVADARIADPVLQTQWGSYAQFYFLSDGTSISPNVVFTVLAEPEEAQRARIVADAARAAGGRVVIPVYTTVPPVNGVDAVGLLEDTAQAESGTLCTVEVFEDRKGREQIRLFRLDLTEDGPRDAGARCEAP